MVLLLLVASCGDDVGREAAGHGLAVTVAERHVRAHAEAPIQPASWIATDLDDADAWATEDSILLAQRRLGGER